MVKLLFKLLADKFESLGCNLRRYSDDDDFLHIINNVDADCFVGDLIVTVAHYNNTIVIWRCVSDSDVDKVYFSRKFDDLTDLDVFVGEVLCWRWLKFYD